MADTLPGWSPITGQAAFLNKILDSGFEAYLVLLTSVTPPNDNTVTMANVSEVAAGNGYTSGGILLGFSDLTIGADVAHPETGALGNYITVAPQSWTASGGFLPNGEAARYAALTSIGAVIANRYIYDIFAFGKAEQVPDGFPFSLPDIEFFLPRRIATT